MRAAPPPLPRFPITAVPASFLHFVLSFTAASLQVLGRGRLLQRGTHEELVAQRGPYRRMVLRAERAGQADLEESEDVLMEESSSESASESEKPLPAAAAR